jgi:hypothetical protein
LYGEVYIGTDSTTFEKFEELIVDKFDTKTRYSESGKLCFLENLSQEFWKSRSFNVLRTLCSPCSEISSCENDLFSAVCDEGIDLIDNIFACSGFVPSACLNGQTKSTKIITSCLDDDKLFGMESGSKNSGFLETFLKRLFIRYLNLRFYIFGVFGKKFDLVSKREKFWVNSIKITINIPLFERSTSRKIDFFSFSQGFEFLFRKTNPFRFSFVRHDARAYKNSLFSIKKGAFCPFIGEIFIGFATEDFVFHMSNTI